jgi:hypothetical protein
MNKILVDKTINCLTFYYAFHSHIDLSIERTISLAEHSPASIERFSDPAEYLDERRFPGEIYLPPQAGRWNISANCFVYC